MKPGYYPPSELSNEDYHKSAGISTSGLKLIDRSPAHFKAGYHSDTAAKFIGTAIHAAALEPDKFKEEYVIGEFGARNAKGFKAWAAEQSRIILLEDEYKRVLGMRKSLHDHPIVGPMLAGAQCEMSCYANDPETGLLCRVRMDMVADNGWIIDLKKTTDARPGPVAKSVASYGYYMQDAFYSDVPKWLGDPPAGFCFVFVEEQPPYAVGLYILDDEDRERGRREYRRLLEVYQRCLETDSWPGYDEEPQMLSLPFWKRKELDYISGAY